MKGIAAEGQSRPNRAGGLLRPHTLKLEPHDRPEASQVDLQSMNHRAITKFLPSFDSIICRAAVAHLYAYDKAEGESIYEPDGPKGEWHKHGAQGPVFLVQLKPLEGEVAPRYALILFDRTSTKAFCLEIILPDGINKSTTIIIVPNQRWPAEVIKKPDQFFGVDKEHMNDEDYETPAWALGIAALGSTKYDFDRLYNAVRICSLVSYRIRGANIQLELDIENMQKRGGHGPMTEAHYVRAVNRDIEAVLAENNINNGIIHGTGAEGSVCPPYYQDEAEASRVAAMYRKIEFDYDR